jgi:hypothetical protein
MRAPSVGEGEREIKHTDSVSLTGRGWLLLLLGFGPWAGPSRVGPVVALSPFFFV